ANNADVTDESHQHYSVAGHIQDGKCNRGTFVLVSDPIVSQLRNAGIEVPLPCNGPADGPPQYRISCQIYEAVLGNNGIPPPPHPTPLSAEMDPSLWNDVPMPMPSVITPSPSPMPIARTTSKATSR